MITQHVSGINETVRKHIHCSFQIGDYPAVKHAWELLSNQEMDPATINIMYKLSLREADTVSGIFYTIIRFE